MMLVPCAQEECGLDAEVTDRWVWPSTDGPIEHIATICPARHTFSGLIYKGVPKQP